MNLLASSKTPRLFIRLLLGTVLAALAPTLWPELDWLAARLFAGPGAVIQAASWPWVDFINKYVPTLFRAMLALALGLWLVASLRPALAAWRLPLAFVVVAGIAGPGAVVNHGFKDVWQRARPSEVREFGGTQQFSRAGALSDQCQSNCSFVSGHVACGFFFSSLLLVLRRRQALWAASGVAAGLTIGFARMAPAAHWFSDVLWAGPVTLTTSWLVWQALLVLYRGGCADSDNKPLRTVG